MFTLVLHLLDGAICGVMMVVLQVLVKYGPRPYYPEHSAFIMDFDMLTGTLICTYIKSNISANIVPHFNAGDLLGC